MRTWAPWLLVVGEAWAQPAPLPTGCTVRALFPEHAEDLQLVLSRRVPRLRLQGTLAGVFADSAKRVLSVVAPCGTAAVSCPRLPPTAPPCPSTATETSRPRLLRSQ